MNNFRTPYKTKYKKNITETKNTPSNFKTKYTPMKNRRKNYFYNFFR